MTTKTILVAVDSSEQAGWALDEAVILAGHPLTLDHLQQSIRLRVCAECPNRTVALDGQFPNHSRPCEATCSLFVHLPALRQIAVEADGRHCDRPATLGETIRTWGGNARVSSRRVVATIEDLLEP